ncbi:hypothetical protein [Radicibacter daui]|uniref:hypothetical protein n=1 Tax=Radicibacter daui TaxID=3064829 RepID=UPI004046D805
MQSPGEVLYYLSGLPVWLSHLIWAVSAAYTMVVCGIVLTRTGRSLYWSLIALIPYAGYLLPLILWLLPWPRVKTAADSTIRG